ncbi:MAG: hypothetical protein R3B45_04775 [Bdellovibrionota bacterium]
MFFGIAKINFCFEPSLKKENNGKSDLKAASSLCHRLRDKLKVCAKVCSNNQNDQISIALAALASTENEIEQLLDKALELCENSELGRVDSEYSAIERIDVLEDEDLDEEG